MAIKNLREFAETLRSNKSEYETLWNDVSVMMGDGAFDRLNEDYDSDKDRAADETTYDPAIRRIRNTIADYYMGLLFYFINLISDNCCTWFHCTV